MTTRNSTPGGESAIDRIVLVFAIVFLIPCMLAFFRAIELGYFRR